MQMNPMPGEPSSSAMICYVDLEALVIVCTDADSILNGAELVDVEATEDEDLVRATYRNPTDGMPVVEYLPMLPPMSAGSSAVAGEPQWKKDGHCCEDCAKGKACEGGACGLPEPELDAAIVESIKIPNHRPVRNPNRRPRIFSRRK